LEPRFTCHELVSGGVALDTAIGVLRGLGSSHYKLLGTLAGLAALRHHHAMRSPRYCEKKAREIPEVCKKQVEALLTEIAYECPCLQDIPIRAIRTTAATCYNPLQSMRKVIEAAKKALNEARSQRELIVMAASTFAGALGLADYLAAAVLDGRRGDQQNPPGYAYHVLRELEWRTGLEPGQPDTKKRLLEISKKGLKLLENILTIT